MIEPNYLVNETSFCLLFLAENCQNCGAALPGRLATTNWGKGWIPTWNCPHEVSETRLTLCKRLVDKVLDSTSSFWSNKTFRSLAPVTKFSSPKRRKNLWEVEESFVLLRDKLVDNFSLAELHSWRPSSSSTKTFLFYENVNSYEPKRLTTSLSLCFAAR